MVFIKDFHTSICQGSHNHHHCDHRTMTMIIFQAPEKSEPVLADKEIIMAALNIKTMSFGSDYLKVVIICIILTVIILIFLFPFIIIIIIIIIMIRMTWRRRSRMLTRAPTVSLFFSTWLLQAMYVVYQNISILGTIHFLH